MVDYNFGVNAPRARIIFRKGGDDRKDSVMAILQALMSAGRVKPDLVELGEIAGLKLEEIEQIVAPAAGGTPGSPDQADQNKQDSGKDTKSSGSKTKKKVAKNAREILGSVAGRVAGQAVKWSKEGEGNFKADFGYERKLADALDLDGFSDSASVVERLYRISADWLGDIPREVIQSKDPIFFMRQVESGMFSALEDIVYA
jgi:hypothetical protein